MKTAAILIPSRGRFDQLLRCIKSFHATSFPGNFDIWVKFDEDDAESIVRISELAQFNNVNIVIGPRLDGYGSIDWFCTRMAEASSAKWICIFNDDATIEGAGWEEQLREVPIPGYIVQPEVYQLGASKYPLSEGGAFPFVPNGCWKWMGKDRIEPPSDTLMDQLLRVKGGWQTWFLTGITANHQRYDTVPK